MIIVQKFGGSSVADIDKISAVARIVAREIEAGSQVVVVVSAMQGQTDSLLRLCSNARECLDNNAAAEYDAVVSSGEQVSAGLLALTLQKMLIPAVSMSGWQAGISTDASYTKARINTIDPEKILHHIKQGKVVVVSGFQGISHEGRVTTLGRGGSDTSAVAIAVACGAERCDVYKDVDGVYTADPRICNSAKKIDYMLHQEMLELSSTGSKVLQVRAVEMAMKYNLDICVRSTFDLEKTGTIISTRTHATDRVICGISHTQNEVMVNISKIRDVNKFYTFVFESFLRENISVDMIIYNQYGAINDMTFVVAKSEVSRMMEIFESAESRSFFESIKLVEDVVKISIVGLGMKDAPGTAKRVFGILANNSIDVLAVSTSDIKISILLESHYMELAVRLLHHEFF